MRVMKSFGVVDADVLGDRDHMFLDSRDQCFEGSGTTINTYDHAWPA